MKWNKPETAPKNRSILVYGTPDPLIMDGIELVTYLGPAVHLACWADIDEAFCLDGGSWLGPFIEPEAWAELPDKPDLNV